MGKKLSLTELKVTSFLTDLKGEDVRGGLLWESSPSCPQECDSGAVSYPCTAVLECQNTADDCESLQYPTNCVFYCN